MLSPSEIVHCSGISGLTMRQPSVVECSVCGPAGKPFSGLSSDPRRAAHRLDAADEHEVGVAGLDRAAGLHRGVEARAAEAVDGAAGDARRQAGEQHGHARDVAVVLAGAVGVAEDDVVDPGGVEVRRALEQRA